MIGASTDGHGSKQAAPTRRRPWQSATAVGVVGFIVLGLVAGWLWSTLVHPPEYAVYPRRYIYYSSESEFQHQFGIDLTFAWIGGVAALVWGLVLGWRYWPHGWALAAVSAVAAAGGAVVAWQFGMQLGPPSLEASGETAQRGDTFTGPVTLGTWSILLVWPIATLLGVIVSVWLRAPRDELQTRTYTANADNREPRG